RVPVVPLEAAGDHDPGEDGLDARRPPRDRPDLRLPGAEPRRHPALRGRLPARLPGGGGGIDGAPAQAADGRGAGADARAGRRPLVDRRAFGRLLHGQGHARPVRRAVPEERHTAGGGRMTPLVVSVVAGIASVLLILVVLELIRSRRLRERYALLWLLTGVVLLVLSIWRSGLNTIAGWVGIRTY